MSLKENLARLINKTELNVSEQQITQLISYVELLNKWNNAYNLTSVRNPEDMLVKHILDSMMVGPHLAGKAFIDVGTGPGLPGIPLAIMYPEKHFTLLDSLGKRITFLKQVVFQLKLANVSPLLSRVEAYQPDVPFDGILSRAFASLEDMVQWCHHLVEKEQGRFYALKGQYPQEELTQLPKGVILAKSYEIKVPELTGERHLIELINV
ncbi:16S rRNA (guanine(527)-N(7))-methyltransferase RsmG [Thalassotalea sp. 1_MG-2023]|uniref:16S rRNA (guanine(527)-N(7))-methyltransferase RsmG n=1 Tax=Thalassotalea sp. 1_MG-2023 TaxID=3062680 RepID=UPI0026E3E794|nr:16S rRNA (guanine(527)-N(7))-methyltransferase RsmG [Thalassotalea sp. 1_MG-2023]MDO6427648.1 16S rRNA (guanine(527)-N(7))-methyltransferase RsmG [Thalassotalea sp. 1_MG-2023]